VCAIEFDDDPDALVRGLQDRFPNARLVGDDESFEQLVAKVVGFVEAPERGLDLPLDIRGTAFQQRVWTAIRDIPAGSTASDRKLPGDRQADRGAEGGACGGAGLRLERHRGRHSLPPGGPHGWIDLGLSLGCCPQARPAGTGEGGMTRALPSAREPAPVSAARVLATQVAALDWASIAAQLDAYGCTTTGRLLTSQQCAGLAGSEA